MIFINHWWLLPKSIMSLEVAHNDFLTLRRYFSKILRVILVSGEEKKKKQTIPQAQEYCCHSFFQGWCLLEVEKNAFIQVSLVAVHVKLDYENSVNPYYLLIEKIANIISCVIISFRCLFSSKVIEGEREWETERKTCISWLYCFQFMQ